jgi:hypothetical protein
MRLQLEGAAGYTLQPADGVDHIQDRYLIRCPRQPKSAGAPRIRRNETGPRQHLQHLRHITWWHMSPPGDFGCAHHVMGMGGQPDDRAQCVFGTLTDCHCGFSSSSKTAGIPLTWKEGRIANLDLDIQIIFGSVHKVNLDI